MIALGNILMGIGAVLDMLLMSVVILVFVRSIVSWVNADPYNPIVRFLTASTEPLIQPLRRYIRPIGGTFDVAPLILILLLFFLRIAVAQSLIEYGAAIKTAAI